jgi:hypothetical protein
MIRGRCDACGYHDTPVEEFGDFSIALDRRPRYCEVCASTFASRAHSEPQSLTVGMLFRTLAVIANLILDKLNEIQNGSKR